MNHGLFAVEHALIHIDVDHLGAVFNLLPCNRQSLVKLVLADQSCEPSRTGNVCAFTNIYEQTVLIQGEWF